MNILTYTTLYPNPVSPHHGVFVENRIRRTREIGGINFRVVAPVPWFPFRSSVLGRYAEFARVPKSENRFGIEVAHPRFPVIPRTGMHVAPALLSAFTRKAVEKMTGSGKDIDAIDAHYFYPDGVAAAILASKLGKPLIITARGTDVNLIPKYSLPRRMILWASRRASAIVTVCEALKDELQAIGVDDRKVTVIRNGVDLHLFRILAREAVADVRTTLGKTVLSVGHLVPRKGHDIVIRALASIPDAELLIVGSGPEKHALQRLAREVGMAHRVQFIGPVAHDEMVNIYNAADVLVLASDREGWPNVLLEAMSCGTPVVASAVWGTPEVVGDRRAGLLVHDRKPESFAAAIRETFSHGPPRTETRAYAEGFGWRETVEKQIALFDRVVVEHRKESIDRRGQNVSYGRAPSQS